MLGPTTAPIWWNSTHTHVTWVDPSWPWRDLSRPFTWADPMMSHLSFWHWDLHLTTWKTQKMTWRWRTDIPPHWPLADGSGWWQRWRAPPFHRRQLRRGCTTEKSEQKKVTKSPQIVMCNKKFCTMNFTKIQVFLFNELICLVSYLINFVFI